MDAVCPREVQDALERARGEPVDVYINSPGGDVFSASEIYAALVAYTGSVQIHGVGQVASAASVILCAGQSDITPTGMVMIHNVSGGARGDYHTMDKASELLQKANRAVVAAYVRKTGKPENEVLAMMDRETWMTAAEAVELGLVDSIAQGGVQLTASAGGMLPRETIEKLRNTVLRPPKNRADLLFAKAALKLLKMKRSIDV
jgi:ATP-dependent Clp endopeptidase proteolytic subunit ClpP